MAYFHNETVSNTNGCDCTLFTAVAVTLSATLVQHWQAFSAMLHASARLSFTSGQACILIPLHKWEFVPAQGLHMCRVPGPTTLLGSNGHEPPGHGAASKYYETPCVSPFCG